MASQTPNSPAPKIVKKDGAEKKGNRNTFVYVGTIIILIITVVAFVFVPSTGGGSAGKNMEFGSYDGKTIAYTQNSYFAKQVELVNNAAKQQGLNDQNYQLFAYQVWRQAFERTVAHIAILDAVDKAGAHVSESFLDSKMLENEAFQDNGQFSARVYRDTPMSTKISIRDGLREDGLSSIYTNDVMSVSPSSKEVAFIKDMAKDTRTIEYAVLPLSSYPDTEVMAWAQANSGLFRRVKLSRFTAVKEADATKYLKQIRGGAAFEETAKAHSTDSYADKGGAMGLHYFYEVQADFANKADAEKLATLKAGEYSTVLKTLAGSWVFYKADDSAFPAELTDPTVLKDARDYMLRFERGKVEDWVTAQAASISNAGAGFDQACKKASLAVATAGPFPLNYGDIDFSAYGQRIPLLRRVNTQATAELAQASTSDAFLTAAFSLAPGSVSKPLVLGDSVIVMKIKEASAATDEEVASISLYYPYFYQQKTSNELSDVFLKSPLLKDNFMTVFFKYFAPKQS
jgi:hypothetical protein